LQESDVLEGFTGRYVPLLAALVTDPGTRYKVYRCGFSFLDLLSS